MKRLGLLVLALFGMSLGARAEIVLNTEAEQLRQATEAKLQHTLETYLGERSKVLVGVQFNLTPEVAVAPTKPAEDPKLEAVGDELWVDLGYVTTPGDVPVREPAAEKNAPPLARKLSIDSVDADVRVSDGLDDATIQEVQNLTVASLQTLNPNVRILKVAFPTPPKKEEPPPPEVKPPPEEKKKDEPAREPAAAAPPEPLDGFDRLVKKFGPLIPLVAAGVVGLGILFAALFASRMLSESAGEIANGIRSMRSTLATSPDKPVSIAPILGPNGESLAGGGPRKGPPKTPPVSPRVREHSRNVAVIKQMLVENPLPFVRSLTDSAADRRGLRWLLASLSAEERTLLKSFLGADRIATLKESTEDEAGAGFDATAWLQDTIEGLVVREVSGVSLIERSLNTPQVLRLSTASPDELYRVAEQVNDPAVWRVVLEFLPKEKILGAMKASDTGLLQKVVAGGDPDATTLQQAAVRIIRELGEAKAQDSSRSTAADDRKRFYANILLEPAIDSVLAKPLGEDDTFLDELSQMAPDFVELLRKKVWTPRSLGRVTNVALKEAFAPLSPAQKTALLLALPAEHSQRLEAFMPDGTGRTIVLDQLRKARERSDLAEFEAAGRLAREFLDFLRRQVEAGKIVLEESRGFGEEDINSATKAA
jgi:hypothetical protein